MAKHTTVYGWERIANVQPQLWRDSEGNVIDAMVWITTTAGELFARSIKKGEFPTSVADFYRTRGCTDSDCAFFAAKAA